ncbi:MAG: lipoyl synthase [Candidatus Omnitrophota bacterium]
MKKRPDWIRAAVPAGSCCETFKSVLDGFGLNTVCVEADCPNRGECWDTGSATFMILGDICTRDCRFCNVKKGVPGDPDTQEPEKIAEVVRKLGMEYAVVTSVTRDDLPEGGTEHFTRVVRAIRRSSPRVPIEILIPDFSAREELLKKIAASGADVIGHNIEMPESLYCSLRPSSSYKNSLNTLKYLSDLRNDGAEIFVKSSLMLGLGETDMDISRTLRDLKEAGVDVIYMGQYLSPSKEHWPVKKYYTPDEFSRFRETALAMGFRSVSSGPMVRSSYRAQETYLALCNKVCPAI